MSEDKQVYILTFEGRIERASMSGPKMYEAAREANGDDPFGSHNVLVFGLEDYEACDKKFAEGFEKGRLAVQRRNKSGCCCIIDDNDKVVSACGAHQNWIEHHSRKLMEELTK